MAKKETIRLRPGRELDRFNDPVGPEPAWHSVPGAIVVPRNSQEYEQRGPIIIAGYMIALPPVIKDTSGTTLDLTDTWEVEVRGDVHQIEGAIGDYGKRIIFYTQRAQ